MVSVAARVGIKGQIVIPKIFRDDLGIVPGSEVVIADENKRLVVRPRRTDLVAVFAAVVPVGKQKGSINSDSLYDEQMRARHVRG